MGMGSRLNRQKYLLAQIQEKRKEMYLYGDLYGLNAPKTIQCSQELDTLLNKYQQLYQVKKSIDIPRKSVINSFVKQQRLLSAK